MAAGDLTTLQKVKETFEVKSSNDDSLLSRLITAASSFISGYTDRDLLSAQATETFDGPGGSTLVVPRYPITAISSLKICGLTIPLRAAWGQNGYNFDGFCIYLSGYIFAAGIRNVEVTYTAGYATIPPALEQACIDLVGFKYRERGHTGETTKGLTGASTSFITDDMPENTKTALNEYRRRVPV